ncbi:lactonase family protein [Roseomonas gilardii subsp. gilardii]|uniref:lactonase family protein n=1 Tax=Roseomonas gilardii TaxID=257708 RepID=UPI001FF973CC|nr:lactonase family protein [Roseomonas gilardii]UPG73691.1 lactonase family protein [Roseomonas gilardii subsp. gilardii]
MMRRLLHIALLPAVLLNAAPSPVRAEEAGALVYIGTHGGPGPGEGLFMARLDQGTGALTGPSFAARIERPTWQASDPGRAVLYSVSEMGNDGKTQAVIHSFLIDPSTGGLTPLGHADSGGGGATHLAYEARSQTLFVANYGGGQVSAIPVLADGLLAGVRSVQVDAGSGPHRRQKGPHAHAVVVDPGGNFLLVPDLGADRVFLYRFDAATRLLSPASPASEALPPGSGPRHLVFSPDGQFAFLNTELSGEIHTYRWDAREGRLTPLSHTAIDPPDSGADRNSSEVAVSGDGRFLYASSRASDSLVVYAIDRPSGALREVQRVPAGGHSPWSFAIDPSGRWMLVANEASDTVVQFAVDAASGRLTGTGNALTVPKPVSFAFYPPRDAAR